MANGGLDLGDGKGSEGDISTVVEAGADDDAEAIEADIEMDVMEVEGDPVTQVRGGSKKRVAKPLASGDGGDDPPTFDGGADPSLTDKASSDSISDRARARQSIRDMEDSHKALIDAALVEALLPHLFFPPRRARIYVKKKKAPQTSRTPSACGARTTLSAAPLGPSALASRLRLRALLG